MQRLKGKTVTAEGIISDYLFLATEIMNVEIRNKFSMRDNAAVLKLVLYSNSLFFTNQNVIMKKLFFLSAVCLGLNGLAQDCQTFLYMTSNAQVQMKVYDQKGKESMIQTWTISDVKKDGNGYVSTLNIVATDEKGKEMGKSTGQYRCNGGVLQADVRMSIPQTEQMKGMQPTEAKMEGGFLEYPHNMSAGQTLKDTDFKMDLSGGIPGSSVEYKQTNRKVQGKESVTTPAGTWEAYKITSDAFMRIKMGIGIPMNMTVTEWFVPGIGVVKTEMYDKKGKLTGTTMITSIKK